MGVIHFRGLYARAFYSHADLDVLLPAAGVVLVTGPNGAGKSAIVECASVAAWGKTLRGEAPWAGPDACAGAHLRGGLAATAARVVKGGRSPTLDVLEDGAGPWTEETTTKKQARLDRQIGTWDTWRRTAVFSAADSAAFTLATDAQRRALLDEVFGFAGVDAALEACRAHLRGLEREAAAGAATIASLHGRITGLRSGLARLALGGAGDVPADPDACDRGAAAAQAEAAEARRVAEGYRLRAAPTEAYRALDAAAREAEARHARVAGGRCPTCHRPADRAFLETILDDARRLRAEFAAVARAADADRAQLLALAAEHDAAARRRGTEAVNLERTAMAARRELAFAADAATRLAAARGELLGVEEELEEAALGAAQRDVRVGVHRAAEAVLGLRGYRAHVIARTLDGLTDLANAWLVRVAGPGLAVQLRPYAERKMRGVSDALSLEITGAGGGRGYRAASAGERRRIDIAVMLGLAETAAAARGGVPGTMFFDEVFDNLDEAGTAAVAGAIGELGRERAVVVITHSDDLAQVLRPNVRLHVAAGRVEAT